MASLAVLAVSEVDWKGVVYRTVWERRGGMVQREREREGYRVRAKCYLVFLTAVYHAL